MRRVRYQVAASLDGYIAGPDGEADWIVMDPEIDFAAMVAQYDTALVGRRTFEAMAAYGEPGPVMGLRTIVVSRTLRQEDHPEVTVVGDGYRDLVAALREEEGKDVWLFGGGELFRTLLADGLVDTVEPAVIPVLLGGGVPLLPPPASRTGLELTGRRVYERTGTVLLEYAVAPPKPAGRRRRRG
ncbi:MAG TPA: dihydrofolate reductase family protein [Thermoanaerobaculia bacterium]|nr:dihydrofolate reductase family protein [Thermoanaerobaculia bacterium]